MLIEIKTNSSNSRFININKIVMLEHGHQGGTFIHLNGMDRLFSPEELNELQIRINEAFDKSKK